MQASKMSFLGYSAVDSTPRLHGAISQKSHLHALHVCNTEIGTIMEENSLENQYVRKEWIQHNVSHLWVLFLTVNKFWCYPGLMCAVKLYSMAALLSEFKCLL
jgi:hypothetical protein